MGKKRVRLYEIIMNNIFSRKIKTEELNRLINLKTPNNRHISAEIALKQAGGIAALYNILCDRNYAYLADEVGMGKTYQALGLASLIWHLKPDARILFIAPRENIQNKWLMEYQNFIVHNCIRPDNRIKEPLLGNPIHRPQTCHSIYEFIKNSFLFESKAFFLRQTSFSYLPQYFDITKTRIKIGEINRLIQKKEPKLFKSALFTADENIFLDNNQITYYIGSIYNKLIPKFDLIIIDEAHNIRRSNNMKLAAMSSIFGFLNDHGIENLPAPETKFSKILLMSATPAHSNIADISSQLSYFEPDVKFLENCHESENLKKYMIRRYRRYKHLTKYDYRNEKPIGITVKDSADELFLAVVQKKLEEELAGGVTINKDSRNKSIYKIGFLECLESYEAKVNDATEPDNEKQSEFTEIDEGESEAPDKKLINDIVSSYREFMLSKGCTSSHPPHPKQDYIKTKARECFESSELKKLLIFVRRIASVKELRERITDEFDAYSFEKIRYLLELKGHNDKNIIEHLTAELQGGPVKSEIEDENLETTDEETDEEESSKILDFFSSSKKGSLLAGAAFKKRFADNRSLSYFFEENYVRTAYDKLTKEKSATITYDQFANKLIDQYLIDEVNNIVSQCPDNYFMKDKHIKHSALNLLVNALCIGRLSEIKGKFDYLIPLAHYLQDAANYISGNDKEMEINNKIKKIDFADIQQHLSRNSFWNCFAGLDTVCQISEIDGVRKREILKKWISKNLRMSDAIIDLAVCYIKSGKSDPDKFIELFSGYINSNSNKYSRKLNNRLKEMINNYDLILKQISSEDFAETDNTQNDWNIFNSQSPVRGVTGGSKSTDRPAKLFNSPFFPDIIVCTDVYKEGVDLHLFCDEIIHYGIAWTPGDLEQRTGRIDRFSCLVHRFINAGMFDKKLICDYPYVKNTIDESQMQKVALNKAETRMKLDMGLSGEVQNEIDSDTIQNIDLEELFKPVVSETFSDPQSELHNTNIDDSEETVKIDNNICENYCTDAIGCFIDIIKKLSVESFVIGHNSDNNNKLKYKFLIKTENHDVKNALNKNRKQMITIEIRFNEICKVYFVRISSEVGNYIERFNYIGNIPELCENVKITYHNNKVFCMSDILYSSPGINFHNLTSYDELKNSIQKVAKVSDFLEYKSLKTDTDNWSDENEL